MAELTQKYLRETLHYDSETGVFTWRIPPARNVKEGSVAGCLTNHGYIQIGVKNKLYMAHRLAWLYVYGKWPTNLIDHINGIRCDNRITNLREATSAENQYNMSKAKNNTSGVKGVTWSRLHKRWRAQCRVNGKIYRLGLFKDICEAEQVVKKFREQHHGKFANHGTGKGGIVPNSHNLNKFTWLFLASRPGDKVAPVVLRTVANTEEAARAEFPGWELIFAAKIRTDSPMNYCWSEKETLSCWGIFGGPIPELHQLNERIQQEARHV